MAEPHSDINTPDLKFAYRLEFNVGNPQLVSNGPYGSRYCFPILKGTFAGSGGLSDFHGTVHTPAADLAIVHADGSGVTLKVHLILKTHDGATILGKAEGKSIREPDNPANARVHLGKTYETGDARYKWMNNQVFVGYGKKEGSNVKINYYQVV